MHLHYLFFYAIENNFYVFFNSFAINCNLIYAPVVRINKLEYENCKGLKCSSTINYLRSSKQYLTVSGVIKLLIDSK